MDKKHDTPRRGWVPMELSINDCVNSPWWMITMFLALNTISEVPSIFPIDISNPDLNRPNSLVYIGLEWNRLPSGSYSLKMSQNVKEMIENRLSLDEFFYTPLLINQKSSMGVVKFSRNRVTVFGRIPSSFSLCEAIRENFPEVEQCQTISIHVVAEGKIFEEKNVALFMNVLQEAKELDANDNNHTAKIKDCVEYFCKVLNKYKGNTHRLYALAAYFDPKKVVENVRLYVKILDREIPPKNTQDSKIVKAPVKILVPRDVGLYLYSSFLGKPRIHHLPGYSRSKTELFDKEIERKQTLFGDRPHSYGDNPAFSCIVGKNVNGEPVLVSAWARKGIIMRHVRDEKNKPLPAISAPDFDFYNYDDDLHKKAVLSFRKKNTQGIISKEEMKKIRKHPCYIFARGVIVDKHILVEDPLAPDHAKFPAKNYPLIFTITGTRDGEYKSFDDKPAIFIQLTKDPSMNIKVWCNDGRIYRDTVKNGEILPAMITPYYVAWVGPDKTDIEFPFIPSQEKRAVLKLWKNQENIKSMVEKLPPNLRKKLKNYEDTFLS